MPFCDVKFFSLALEKAVGMNVILPEVSDPGPYPVFYLLHGLSDDYTIWYRRTRIEWYVRELPLIVVMPDGGRGWYTDAVDGAAYETFFTHDLIQFVDRFFPTRADRTGRAIGGLSMGGYGAMKLGLKHPDLFCSVHSHSGALDIARTVPTEDAGELGLIFGKTPANGPDDLWAIAEELDTASCPALRIDCGVSDWLIAQNRAFHRHLEVLKIPHEYAEFPGDHAWDYWDLHVQEALAFHMRSLQMHPHATTG